MPHVSWTEAASVSDFDFVQEGTGAVTRTLHDVLMDHPLSILDFGGSPLSPDNSPAITLALAAANATGRPLHFPATSDGSSYLFSSSIITFTNLTLTSDDRVVFQYTGSTGAAINLTGTRVKVQIGEVFAGSAPYAIRYYNLEYSDIKIRRPGACTAACIFHSSALQTANAGNNRWVIEDIQAGSVPYGIYIENTASFLLEGEIWDVKVIFSATTAAIRIGTSTASQRVRWNTYKVAIDAQGITPLLIDVYQDSNNFELINWSGLAVPPVAHVRFNASTQLNYLEAKTGVENPLAVLDQGINVFTASGTTGQLVVGGKMTVGTIGANVTGLLVQAGRSAASGANMVGIENTSSDSGTNKWVGFGLRGRDTINSGKDVGMFRAVPVDNNWTASRVELHGRSGDVLLPTLILSGVGSPQGVVTASVGALYTRSDGAAGTTLYVKESGNNTNTGWVAK